MVEGAAGGLSLAGGHWKCSRCGVHISALKAKGERMSVHHADLNPANHAPANLRLVSTRFRPDTPD
jgi:hypothetical protein